MAKDKPRAMIKNIQVWCAHDEIVPIDKLIPNPRNPNTHPPRQIEMLAKIIKHQGWRGPITVSTRSGFIVRGHGRRLAALQAGLTQCPVDYQHYENEAAEWADLIADNQIAELSVIDEDLATELLREIDSFHFDMELTGFELDEVADFLGQDPEGNKDLGGKGDEPPPEKQERVILKSIPCFMGAYCLKQAQGIDFDQLKAWKEDPQGNQDFENTMINEICKAWDKRQNHIDFVTVPPPNGKRKDGYTQYPISRVAKEVARRINKPYLEIFEPRQKKTRHGRGARTHQEQEKYVIKQKGYNKHSSCLLIDDVSTTRTTLVMSQDALAKVNISCFALVWCYWGNV